MPRPQTDKMAHALSLVKKGMRPYPAARLAKVLPSSLYRRLAQERRKK